jgi:hypothetical protein
VIVDIRLPAGFTVAHRAAVLRFVQGKPTDDAQYAARLEAFDLLHRATVDGDTFVAFYERVVEKPSADLFIAALLDSSDPQAAAPALRQEVNQRIPSLLRQAGCANLYQVPEFYLLAYCLYWWYAFTTGYTFEVTILRDLTTSGVEYYAHDLSNRQARRSPFDLVVLGFTGDVKTSTYFLHAVRSRGLPTDFYITRLYDRSSRAQLRVVFLKRSAWDAIDGETLPTTLAALPNVLPVVAEIEHGGQTLVVVEYGEWKTRVLKRQRGKEEQR